MFEERQGIFFIERVLVGLNDLFRWLWDYIQFVFICKVNCGKEKGKLQVDRIRFFFLKEVEYKNNVIYYYLCELNDSFVYFM